MDASHDWDEGVWGSCFSVIWRGNWIVFNCRRELKPCFMVYTWIAGLNWAPRLWRNRRREAYGVGTSRWAYAAMRWLCSFKTSGQLVSWWTGGVEGDDGHRCSDTVCLDVEGGGGIGWVGPWTEYKQKSEQVLKYEEREGESGAGRMCVLQKVNALGGAFFCVKQTMETGVSLWEESVGKVSDSVLLNLEWHLYSCQTTPLHLPLLLSL